MGDGFFCFVEKRLQKRNYIRRSSAREGDYSLRRGGVKVLCVEMETTVFSAVFILLRLSSSGLYDPLSKLWQTAIYYIDIARFVSISDLKGGHTPIGRRNIPLSNHFRAKHHGKRKQKYLLTL